MGGVLSKDTVVLFDTNVWLDLFCSRGESSQLVGSILDAIERAGAAVATSVGSTKDVFYLVQRDLKRQPLPAGGDQEAARIRKAVAWICVREMRLRSIIVGSDLSDIIQAEHLKACHDDYEDDLVLSAAKRANATFLVTDDRQLREHAPISSYSVAEFAMLVSEGDTYAQS